MKKTLKKIGLGIFNMVGWACLAFCVVLGVLSCLANPVFTAFTFIFCLWISWQLEKINEKEKIKEEQDKGLNS